MASTPTEWPKRESKRERECVCILKVIHDQKLGIDDDVHVFECRRLEIPTIPHPHPCGDQEPSHTSDMLELLHTSTPITSIRILLGGRQFYVYT